ncbi:DNA-processing protein DprA [Desulfallas sp. Bu1-1]|uniref:DNA-processing protein DprA n=1 Tax=Desulfallas sp. Bu1-1 TaxID=2787620 RepID=UPI0028BE2DA6|nr:DNA-processing protein DprA [Desulfallas sp. Bu1-1]
MKLLKLSTEDKVYWLAWHMILAGQANKFWRIMDHFGNPREAWYAPDREFGCLAKAHRNNLGELLSRRKDLNLHELANYLNHKDIKIIFFSDEGYPEQLKTIFDPPPVLFVRGQSRCLHETGVAMVGSRRASHYGLSVAESLSRQLAEAGVNIISGMARGIDAAAHRGALQAGGKTIAVLGCGVDVIYPRENGKIMVEIIRTGAVVSEFPPGAPPEAWHFPVRNRVISGLSKVVVVVEAAEKSGALITAHAALEQGRDVMAVPGNITSKLSRGANGLIKQGAAPVLGAEDILEELGVGVIFPPRASDPSEGVKLTEIEQKLNKIINFEPVPLEVIVQQSGVPAGEVMSALMFLEMKGLVRQLPGKLFARIK